METSEFQKKCAEIVKKIDERYNISRDLQLSLAQLMEEIGELSKELNKPKLRNSEINFENLKGEFADVFLQLSILAEIAGVDLEIAVKEKVAMISKRHFNA